MGLVSSMHLFQSPTQSNWGVHSRLQMWEAAQIAFAAENTKLAKASKENCRPLRLRKICGQHLWFAWRLSSGGPHTLRFLRACQRFSTSASYRTVCPWNIGKPSPTHATAQGAAFRWVTMRIVWTTPRLSQELKGDKRSSPNSKVRV